MVKSALILLVVIGLVLNLPAQTEQYFPRETTTAFDGKWYAIMPSKDSLVISLTTGKVEMGDFNVYSDFTYGEGYYNSSVDSGYKVIVELGQPNPKTPEEDIVLSWVDETAYEVRDVILRLDDTDPNKAYFKMLSREGFVTQYHSVYNFPKELVLRRLQ